MRSNAVCPLVIQYRPEPCSDMKGTASRKVPDGKLVRVTVRYDEEYEETKITGDFFIEPPEGLNQLTTAVEGLPVSTPREGLIEAIEGTGVDLIGFTADDLAIALRAAVGHVEDADEVTAGGER